LVTGMIFTSVKIAVRSASSRVRSRMDYSCPIMPDYPLWRNRPVRERGWIVRDGGTWHLWYTGSNRDQSPLRRLGHATSCDGLNWRRDVANPLVRDRWVEDVCVVRGAGRSPPARTRPATGQTS
jgi:hypothetical protein